MARKIIILERTDMPSDANYRVAFWLDVPAARQAFYANAQAKSVVIGATAGEISAIQTGAVVEVVEVVETLRRPAGTTLAAMRTLLAARHGELQADLIARNPYDRYGTSWDGAAWTAGGVA